MSFSQTCVRPRLLFGRFIQAYCKRNSEGEESYNKSTLDLDLHLGNNNGNFTTSRAKSLPFNKSPYDVDNNAHLEGSNIVADLPTKDKGRNHARYDLDVCLQNDNGQLKWAGHDGLLARDGILTKMAEGIPGAGCLVGLIHHLNNYPEHAKRALIISGKGAFVIAFGIIALEIGPFNPNAALPVAFMAFLGTVIADLLIETPSKAWIKDKRIAAEIPSRTWVNIFLDGLIVGIGAAAATGVAPHAEVAAARAIRAAIQVPEELVLTEIELLSIQSLVANGPRLAKEVIKAGTGGVVRATGFGIQDYATRGPQAECSSQLDVQSSKIKPGHYYISNFETGQLLQFIISNETGRTCIQVSEGNFRKSQLWIVEEGNVGFKIRGYFPSAYIGYSHIENSTDLKPCIVPADKAVEFTIEGNHREGYVFTPISGTSSQVALSVSGSDTKQLSVLFTANTGTTLQRWLLEEDDGVDTLELYQGPVPANTQLQIRDAAGKTPLRLPTPRQGWALWPTTQAKRDGDWILEASFNGYRLKHSATGLYLAFAEKTENVGSRSLTLSPEGEEFALAGDEEGGYSIISATDSKFGLAPEEDASGHGSTAFLGWQPDDNHPKWHFEIINSD